MGTLSVYMAGPDVFLPSVKDIAKAKKSVLKDLGLEGLHPFDNEIDIASMSPMAASALIMRENCKMMEGADLILANLTPFHGPSADVGTAFEVGFMCSARKPIYAYSNVSEPFAERVDGFFENYSGRDAQEAMIRENFGLFDNLMLPFAVVNGPAHGFASVDVPPRERYTSLDAFTVIARRMAEDIHG